MVAESVCVVDRREMRMRDPAFPDSSRLRSRPHVADGGWSTQLRMRGYAGDAPVELANLTHPQLVQQLARAYVEAGAEFVTTNTFGANRFVFERAGIEDDPCRVAEAGARLARAAVGEEAWVVGSIGPSGRMLVIQESTPEELTRLFAEQARALAAGGADAIVLETFSEPAEIQIAIAAAGEASGLPVIASMSFDCGPQRTRTMMGAEAGACAELMEASGAAVVGCNCGSGIEDVLPAVVALRAHTRCPLWVKPNAGVPELIDGQVVYRVTPDAFAAHVPALLDAGADIVGGCCGTGPAHIQAVARRVAGRREGRGPAV